jgi:hypothetical protein
MIEQASGRKLGIEDMITERLLHAPGNLRPIVKGYFEHVVHLSRIRTMWNRLYALAAGLKPHQRFEALKEFLKHTDEFLTHMEHMMVEEMKVTGKTLAEIPKDRWRDIATAWESLHDAEEAARKAVEIAEKL